MSFINIQTLLLHRVFSFFDYRVSCCFNTKSVSYLMHIVCITSAGVDFWYFQHFAKIRTKCFYDPVISFPENNRVMYIRYSYHMHVQ